MLNLRTTSNEIMSEIRDSSGRILIALGEEIKTLDDLDLTDAVFDHVQADGLICMGAKFDNASFKAADLYWMVAIQASMRNANLEDCVFRGGTLSAVKFDGALLRRTRFIKDNLGGRTDLSAADLSGAVLDGADFSGACYDADTKFPLGFDPAASGLIRCEDNRAVQK